MELSQLKNAFLIAPHPGANLTATDPDGVVVAQIGFPGGIHKLADVRNWFPQGTTFTPENGAVFAERRGDRTVVIRNAEANETGANLEWQPTRMTALEKTMYVAVRNLQRKVDMQAKRAATVTVVAKGDPVVEDPDPTPAKPPQAAPEGKKPEAEPVAAE